MLHFSFTNTSRILDLNAEKLGSARIIKRVEDIGKIGATRILVLSNNEITDAAIPAIVQHLILNTKISLEELDLGGNKITDEGAQQLIKALEQRNTLRKLTLNGNPEITSESIKKATELVAENNQRQKQGKCSRGLSF